MRKLRPSEVAEHMDAGGGGVDFEYPHPPPATLLLSPTLKIDFNRSFNFNNKNTTAHWLCAHGSHVQAMRRARLVDGAVPS